MSTFRLRRTLLGKLVLQVAERELNPTMTATGELAYNWRDATERDIDIPLDYCFVQVGVVAKAPE